MQTRFTIRGKIAPARQPALLEPPYGHSAYASHRSSVPFAGTALGAACVFLLKRSLGAMVQRVLTGFAAGVMVAASVWSLLIPALEEGAALGAWSFVPALVGLWVGVLFLLLLDHVVPHLHQNADEPEGPATNWQRSTKLVLAVTLHNVPEGMAVGVVCAGAMAGDSLSTEAAALALAVGLAIQNFPEGAIVSMPLHGNGMAKGKAFGLGVLRRASWSPSRPWSP